MKLLPLALIFSIFTSLMSQACMFPNSGEEYDALIKVDKPQTGMIYFISFPRSVNSSKGTPTIFLNYVSEAIEEDCIDDEEIEKGMHRICMPIDSYREEVNILNWKDWLRESLWFNKKTTFSGQLLVTPREGYSVHVDVMWPSDVCLTFGKKSLNG
jgi:hypothetical protein